MLFFYPKMYFLLYHSWQTCVLVVVVTLCGPQHRFVGRLLLRQQAARFQREVSTVFFNRI
jgi:hypothetical protein